MKVKRLFVVMLMIAVVCVGYAYFSPLITAKADDGDEVVVESTYETSYQLQDSVYEPAFDGQYISWLSYYNCYSYAIGRYNQNYDGTADKSLGIGVPSTGREIPLSATTIEQMAYTVKADLETLSCINVTVSTVRPMVSGSKKLICVRKKEQTSHYHFMRYDSEDGYWYHKPGISSVLKYKYEPSNDRNWTDEHYDGGAHKPTLEYDSQIYYISYNERLKIDTRNGGYIINGYEDFEYIQQFGYNRGRGTTWTLTNPISIPGDVNWTPLTDMANTTIDGDGYSISGLKIARTAQEINATDSQNLNIGFVSETDSNTTIKNIVFRDVEIRINGEVDFNKTLNIGVIAGVNNGSITNCTVGNARIYGEANISSVTNANIGAICGINNHPIYECNAYYFHVAGFGNLGGIAGKTTAYIYSCSVGNSSISLYWGTAGGICGESKPCTCQSETLCTCQSGTPCACQSGTSCTCECTISYSDYAIEKCNVSNVTISCYNGYPDVLPQYYATSHYAYVGGISGSNTRMSITSCNVRNSGITYNGVQNNSTTLAPEMGTLCGRATSSNFIISCGVVATQTSKGNLQTVTWTTGFWPFQSHHSYEQAQYVGGEVGRYMN